MLGLEAVAAAIQARAEIFTMVRSLSLSLVDGDEGYCEDLDASVALQVLTVATLGCHLLPAVSVTGHNGPPWTRLVAGCGFSWEEVACQLGVCVKALHMTPVVEVNLSRLGIESRRCDGGELIEGALALAAASITLPGHSSALASSRRPRIQFRQ